MVMMDTIRVAEACEVEASLVALNGTAVTLDQLAAAGCLVDEMTEWNLGADARHATLSAALGVDIITATAIGARLAALRAWQDSLGLHSAASNAMLGAATLSPLIQSDTGVGFDPARFQDLVDFVAELPW
jgi:hypothetical protein